MISTSTGLAYAMLSVLTTTTFEPSSRISASQHEISHDTPANHYYQPGMIEFLFFSVLVFRSDNVGTEASYLAMLLASHLFIIICQTHNNA